MVDFFPTALKALENEMAGYFPLPSDYVYKDETFMQEIMHRKRSENSNFDDLSSEDFKLSYSLSKLCTEEEFEELKSVFKYRVNSALFDIGWVYFQLHPEEKRAAELFFEAAKWLEEMKPEEFVKTLVGRTGLIWSDIFLRSSEIIRIDRLTFEEFCKKFNIIERTKFFEQLQLTYFSKCEKNELLSNEDVLARLIAVSDLEYIRPAIKNYTAKIPYEEMSEAMNDAISYRVSVESPNETLGLSPTMLNKLRSLRFCTVFGECVDITSSKSPVYNDIAGSVRNIELLNYGFFTVDFGNYIVIDNSDWREISYAYLPEVFKSLLEKWKASGYPQDFWPGVPESDIAEAKDVVLGTKKSDVVKLRFSDFDLLYAKDMLSITRY